MPVNTGNVNRNALTARQPATSFRLKGPDGMLAYTLKTRVAERQERRGIAQGRRAMTLDLYPSRARVPVESATVVVTPGQMVRDAVANGLIALSGPHADNVRRLARNHRQVGAWFREAMPSAPPPIVTRAAQIPLAARTARRPSRVPGPAGTSTTIDDEGDSVTITLTKKQARIVGVILDAAQALLEEGEAFQSIARELEPIRRALKRK